MEEYVGNIWHRWITKRADSNYQQGRVNLADVGREVSMMFRALGGDAGLRVSVAAPKSYQYRRSRLQEVAGSAKLVSFSSRNDEVLLLPDTLAAFPKAELNRELYLWLAALATRQFSPMTHWLQDNQQFIKELLLAYPGLSARYQRLLAAHLALRPKPEHLPDDEAAQERLIRRALQEPGSVCELPQSYSAPFPVALWLYPAPLDHQNAGDVEGDEKQSDGAVASAQKKAQRRRAEYTDDPASKDSLMAFRLESLFSWAEYVNLDRAGDDEEDEENAARAAEDLELLSMAKQRRAGASKLRMDLDLPAAENDELALGPGEWLPEWDHRKQQLIADFCCVQPMLDIEAEPNALPDYLQPVAKRLRSQFENLAPVRFWQRRQMEGEEIDLDAWIELYSESKAGHSGEQRLYRNFRGEIRDLDCLLLADISMSTDAHVDDQRRVIEVIQESLLLFGEALAALGDRFSLYAFSSRKRQHVRFHLLKNFAEPYNDAVRGRILNIKPGFYTRMGAAIRQATKVLQLQPGSQKLLLLLTDGKPNDIDHYEGRYGVEDTRMAIIEARQAGLTPFCITIDSEADQYLPHIFGLDGFAVIDNAARLPRELPRLYAMLTQ